MDELYSEALLDRIKLLYRQKRVNSINNWAKLLDMHQSALDRMWKGQAKLNLEFVAKILELYPDVSAEWLLRDAPDRHDAITEKSIANEAILRNMKLDLEMAEKKLARQSEEINDLREIIQKKNKIIDEFIH